MRLLSDPLRSGRLYVQTDAGVEARRESASPRAAPPLHRLALVQDLRAVGRLARVVGEYTIIIIII